MQIKRVIIFVVISMLSIFMLTGCPPQLRPLADSLSAKEFWDIIKPYEEMLGNDLVPVYIVERGTQPDYNIIDKGKAYNWLIGFYSEQEHGVWEVGYLSYLTEDGTPSKVGAAGKVYSDVSLTASGLADWNIDSPEAYEIAVQNGAGEAILMILQTARLGSLAGVYNDFYDTEFIPDSTKIFWSIWAGDIYYVDACTGEYLGSNTVEEVNEIRKEAQYTPVS